MFKIGKSVMQLADLRIFIGLSDVLTSRKPWSVSISPNECLLKDLYKFKGFSHERVSLANRNI
jgi:hypothetical protein